MRINSWLYAWVKIVVFVFLMGMVALKFNNVFSGTARATSVAGEADKLFNGKDLNGWRIDGADVWFVENGIVAARGTGEESHIWTTKDYEYYEISLSYKMEGNRSDSGVFMGSTDYQVQFGISGSLKVDMTGCVYYGGSGKGKGTYIARFPEPEKVVRKGDWNDITIRVTRDRIEVTLNEKKVLDFTETEATRSFNSKGPIGLQLHGNVVMNVFFRDVRVKKIDL